MFQSFEEPVRPGVAVSALGRLRAELERRGLDGFVLPRADEHLNEYVPASAERLRWLTGFTGSAGLAIVLRKRAAVFVDGRYTVQAKQQIDTAEFEIVSTVEASPQSWIEANLVAGETLGLDPWLHAAEQVARYEAAASARGGKLVLLGEDPVGAVWADRPLPPLGAVTIQPLALAGESAAAKLDRVRQALVAARATDLALTQPDGVAWLFNIRGKDVGHTPLPLAYALVPANGRPRLFIDARKLSNEARAHIEDAAGVEPYEDFRAALAELGRGGAAVLVDPASAPAAVGRAVEGAGGRVVSIPDPTILMKARKNAAELDGARAAHRRDGAAMAAFLHWFDGASADLKTTEITVAEALEGFRRATGALEDISFPSIAGAGPDGAIIHYRVTRATDRTLDRDSLFLIDSGGQYRDGTTDVTRTLAVGRPSAEMRARFTDVLKGMIAISLARFPRGTTGQHLDALARVHLWRGGFDYDHGTGHGVGSYLSVHEGPCRIAKTPSPPLEPGMILSNEPGYYRTGAFGIRIENLLVVAEPAVPAGGDRPMMCFETLTLVPIDRRCIDEARLSDEERAFVDGYHARVRAEIGPLVEPAVRAWLDRVCAPL